MKCESYCGKSDCTDYGCQEENSTVYVWSPYKPTREEFERLRKLYDERKNDLRFLTTPKRSEKET